jgi:hypothetical protein
LTKQCAGECIIFGSDGRDGTVGSIYRIDEHRLLRIAGAIDAVIQLRALPLVGTIDKIVDPVSRLRRAGDERARTLLALIEKIRHTWLLALSVVIGRAGPDVAELE